MSNIAAPQCSSGVESGWTLYLHDDNDENESSIVSVARTIPGSYRSRRKEEEEEEEEEDDDGENLSMVSDASSGPPYYEVQGWSGHGFHAGSELSAQKKDKRQPSRSRQSHYEDTASSRQVGNSLKNFNQPAKNHASTRHALDFPRDYSIPNLKEKPEYGNRYHYLQPHAADQNSGSRRAGHSRKWM